MNARESIEEMLTDCNKMISLVTKELNRSPRGRLSISNQKDGLRFMKEIVKDGSRIRKGIGRDTQMLYRLANKAYLKEELLRLKANAAVLEDCLNRIHSTNPVDILKSLPANYSFLNAPFIIDPGLISAKPLYPCPVRNVDPVQLRTTTGPLSPLE